ncbi:MAG: glutaminase [Alphaproteobacteria bacterium]|nr:glutaminase [Alphaproteobacteria bacterium]
MTDLQNIVDEIHAELAPRRGEGKVADYIPALARVDAKKFGLAVVDLDGKAAIAGDAKTPFSIQSISKVFTLTMALGRSGAELWTRVGREPSGSPFNSIVQLEAERGIPRNPLINAGALVVTDTLLDGRGRDETAADILAFMRERAGGEPVTRDAEVAASEAATGFRNASLANFIRAFGNIHNPIDDVLAVYFGQCAIAASCLALARAGLFLANEGVDPLAKRRVIDAAGAARRVAVTVNCAPYDAARDVALSLGLPGKSGLGGGILAVAPKRAAIAVWSPGLGAAGTSLLGGLALEKLAARTGWSVF